MSSPNLVKRASFAAPWLSELDCKLFAAVKIGDADEVDRVLDDGASVSCRGPDNETPLHVASFNGHVDCCRKLIDRGCAVNMNEKFRGTPLHVAAMNGHLTVVRLLLESGALPTAKSIKGLMAHQVASTPEIADLILAAKKLRKKSGGSRRGSMGLSLPTAQLISNQPLPPRPVAAADAQQPSLASGQQPVIADGRVIIRGFLLRKGRFGRFKQRVVVVETKGLGTKLSWFKSSAHTDPLGVFRLRGSQCKVSHQTLNGAPPGRSWAFELVGQPQFQIPGEPARHLFVARSEADRAHWVNVLQRTIEFVQTPTASLAAPGSYAPSPQLAPRRRQQQQQQQQQHNSPSWTMSQTDQCVTVSFCLPAGVSDAAVSVKVYEKYVDISLHGFPRPVVCGPLWATVIPKATDTQILAGAVTVELRKAATSHWPQLLMVDGGDQADAAAGQNNNGGQGNNGVVVVDDDYDDGSWSESESEEPEADDAASVSRLRAALGSASPPNKKASAAAAAAGGPSKLSVAMAKKRTSKKLQQRQQNAADDDDDPSFDAFVQARTSSGSVGGAASGSSTSSSPAAASPSADLLDLSYLDFPSSSSSSSSSQQQQQQQQPPPQPSHAHHQMHGSASTNNLSLASFDPFAAAPATNQFRASTNTIPSPAASATAGKTPFNPFEPQQQTSAAANPFNPFE